MGALVKLIKGLIAGIAGIFGGLLKGKQSSDGFFLEADGASADSEAPAAAPVAAVAEAPAPAATANTVKKTKTTKKAAAAVDQPAVQASAPAAAPAPAATASFAANGTMMMDNTPRRRPGANMKSYVDMAKQVKRF